MPEDCGNSSQRAQSMVLRTPFNNNVIAFEGTLCVAQLMYQEPNSLPAPKSLFRLHPSSHGCQSSIRATADNCVFRYIDGRTPGLSRETDKTMPSLSNKMIYWSRPLFVAV